MITLIFSSLDDKSLKHLIDFIREIAQQSNTKKILQEYDFCSGIQAAIMVSQVDSFDLDIYVELNCVWFLFRLWKMLQTIMTFMSILYLKLSKL